jgi:hypothetical protein
VYERYYASGDIAKETKVRLLICNGKVNMVDPDRNYTVCAVALFDMTPVFKFISRPWYHGMTQEHLRAYRKLVNL